MKKIIPLLLLLIISCNKNKKVDYTPQLSALKKAFEQKKIDPLQPYLANGYTIKGLPQGMESMIFPKLLEALPTVEKYEIKSETPEKMGMRIKAIYHFKGIPPQNANFLIAGDGKFLELNFMNEAMVEVVPRR